jgi:hypothetical protein
VGDKPPHTSNQQGSSDPVDVTISTKASCKLAKYIVDDINDKRTDSLIIDIYIQVDTWVSGMTTTQGMYSSLRCLHHEYGRLIQGISQLYPERTSPYLIYMRY